MNSTVMEKKQIYIIRSTFSNGSVAFKPMKFIHDKTRKLYLTKASSLVELGYNLTAGGCVFLHTGPDPIFPKENCAWVDEPELVD